MERRQEAVVLNIVLGFVELIADAEQNQGIESRAIEILGFWICQFRGLNISLVVIIFCNFLLKHLNLAQNYQHNSEFHLVRSY